MGKMGLKKAELLDNILSYNEGKAAEFHIVAHAVLDETDDLIIYLLERENRQQLVCFCFKLSSAYDSWFWLLPTENMIKKLIKKAPMLIEILNQKNGKAPARDSMSLDWY